MKVIRFRSQPRTDGLSITVEGDYETNDIVRPEGSVLMDLAKPTFELEGIDCFDVHPDIVTLAAVLAFYPAFPTESFAMRLPEGSANILAALKLPHILPQAQILIEEEAPEYRPHREGVLSYGGGFDSLAAHNLFPDLPLVHETPLPNDGVEYEDVVNNIVSEFSVESHVVRDNLRVLFTKWGLPLWVSIYIPSLLLQPRYVISGSELTGTYLLGGQKYHPRYANRWYEVFRIIGVSILPTSFLSEIGNARIVYGAGMENNAAYCALIRNRDCGRCTKCLRRRAIRAMIEQRPSPVNSFTSSPSIDAFLAKRPLYYGDVFTHAINRGPRTWLSDRLSDLSSAHPDLGFHDKYYPEAFNHFAYSTKYRALAERRMIEFGILSFSAEDEAQFVEFQQVQ